jgi:hypothetical protein
MYPSLMMSFQNASLVPSTIPADKEKIGLWIRTDKNGRPLNMYNEVRK